MPPEPARKPRPDTPPAQLVDPAWGGGEPLSARNFTRLAELVHDYSGIKMPAGKRTMLEGRLRRRMRAVGVDDLNDYCRYLFEEEGLKAEIIHLIDAVTTNKTDFFREPLHFRLLQDQILPTLGGAGRRSIKAWSAACSIGGALYPGQGDPVEGVAAIVPASGPADTCSSAIPKPSSVWTCR